MLDRWLKVIEGRGTNAVKQVYLDTLNGRVPPDQGHVLSLTAWRSSPPALSARSQTV
jgi:hypothetical protein